MNKLSALIIAVLVFFVALSSAKMVLELPSDPEWGQLIPLKFTFSDSVPATLTPATSFDVDTDALEFISPTLQEFAFGAPNDLAPCHDEDEVRFGSITQITSTVAESKTSITIIFDNVPTLTSVITCYIRIVGNAVDISTPIIFSSTFPDFDSVSLPVPTDASLDKATLSAALSSGQSSDTLPSFFQEYDLSEILLSYTSLPPNSLLPVQFQIVDLDQTYSNVILEPMNDKLRELTTSLVTLGLGFTTPQCSNHVRLFLINSDMYILTGDTPTDGSCSIPFSQQSLGLLGFFIATDYVISPEEGTEADAFDLQDWFQNVVEVEVSVGSKSAKVSVGTPDMNEYSEGKIDEDGTLVITAYAPENPEFEVTGSQGISLDTLVFGATGFYASFKDLIAGDTSSSLVMQQGLPRSSMKSADIVDNIIDFAQGLQFKLSKLTSSGFARLEVQFPALSELTEPVTIEYTFAGKTFAVAYRPPVVINTTPTGISSLSDTELTFVVGFKMVAAQFNVTASTPAEYALIVSYPYREYRSYLYPHPICTPSRDDLTIENGSLSPTGLDTHYNSYIKMRISSAVISDSWSITCVQQLLPGDKYTKQSEKIISLKIENRFIYTEALVIAEILDNTYKLSHYLQLPSTDISWNSLPVKESTASIKVYSYSLSAQVDIDTVVTRAVTLLQTAPFFDGDSAFKTLETTDLRWVVDETPTVNEKETQDQYLSSQKRSLKTNPFTNLYVDSIAEAGSALFLGFAASFTSTLPGVSFDLYDPENNLRVQYIPGTVNIDDKIQVLTIFGGKTDNNYYPGLQSAVSGACFSTSDCPDSYCYNGICLHDYQIPSEVRAFVTDTNPFQADSAGISLYFDDSSATTASFSMVMIALICALALFFNSSL